jgi:hypothetical protein
LYSRTKTDFHEERNVDPIRGFGAGENEVIDLTTTLPISNNPADLNNPLLSSRELKGE